MMLTYRIITHRWSKRKVHTFQIECVCLCWYICVRVQELCIFKDYNQRMSCLQQTKLKSEITNMNIYVHAIDLIIFRKRYYILTILIYCTYTYAGVYHSWVGCRSNNMTWYYQKQIIPIVTSKKTKLHRRRREKRGPGYSIQNMILAFVNIFSLAFFRASTFQHELCNLQSIVFVIFKQGNHCQKLIEPEELPRSIFDYFEQSYIHKPNSGLHIWTTTTTIIFLNHYHLFYK